MNTFKVIAREGHHAVVDIQFEDERTAKAVCAVLAKITGVVVAGQAVVLTPAALEGAIRTNGGQVYALTSLSSGIPKAQVDRRRCHSRSASADSATVRA